MPQIKDSEARVTFSYMGKAFFDPNDKEHVPLENREASEFLPEENFLLRIVETNARGTRDDILQLWMHDEREKISRAMESQTAFERNSALFRNVEETYLLSAMRYEKYILLFVEHKIKGIGAYKKIYPVTRVKASYYMTNKLLGDDFYERIAPVLLEYVKLAEKE